jgi:type II secretion system protein H
MRIGQASILNSANAAWNPRARRGAGFTLIELMVVLVLIAIMTGVVVSEMTGTREDAMLKAEARKLMNVLSLANSRAITLGQTHRVQFQPSSRHFDVQRKVHEAGEGIGFADLKDAPGSAGEWDERVKVEFPGNSPDSESEQAEPGDADEEPSEQSPEMVQFYSDGTADPLRILLRDRAGFEILLKVNPATGRVKATQLTQK